MRRELSGTLRHLREQAGLTQAEVAALLGVTRPAISKLESGRSTTTVELFERWAALFQRTVVLVEAEGLSDLSANLMPEQIRLVRQLIVLLPRLETQHVVTLWALIEAWGKSAASPETSTERVVGGAG